MLSDVLRMSPREMICSFSHLLVQSLHPSCSYLQQEDRDTEQKQQEKQRERERRGERSTLEATEKEEMEEDRG